MRTLAIDYGTRRIGVAMSDEGGKFATPMEVIAVNDPLLAIPAIAALIRKEGVRRLVAGLPINMDDSIGGSAKAVVRFVAELKKIIDVPVVFVDERLSSFEAEQQLVDRKRGGEKLTRKRKREQLDAVVAANLLQQFLDGKLAGIDVTNFGENS
jgi:putative holliday junction resolvase